MMQRDPQFDWRAFQGRVAMIFGAMQASWSNRDWASVRPFVSDNLFQMLAYWIEAYRRERLRNVTEGARVEQIELARMTSDKFFDSMTVRALRHRPRLHRDRRGRACGRGKSAQARGATPNTGRSSAAPAKKGPRGSTPIAPRAERPCASKWRAPATYCRAKVTSGEFDWVLSRIEQDEVYGG